MCVVVGWDQTYISSKRGEMWLSIYRFYKYFVIKLEDTSGFGHKFWAFLENSVQCKALKHHGQAFAVRGKVALFCS